MAADNALSATLSRETGWASHLLLALFLILLLALGLWAWRGTLDIVSVAGGEVVPSGQVKTIQHLEGGIIREIKVREGELVRPGQELVVLESTASGADFTELETRVTGLRVEAIRLTAEAADAPDLVFPAALAQSHPKLVREAQALFLSRRDRLRNDIAVQDALISQRELDVREITTRIANNRKSVKLLEEQIGISDQLLKIDLTNRYKHLELLKENQRLSGAIDADRVAIERAKSALGQAEANKAAMISEYKQDVSAELDAARRQLEEFLPRLTKFEDNLNRTILRSPVQGLVKTLHVVTIGGVLKPGDPVMDIVPVDERLVIEAKLPTQDIGFVQSGQVAMIKLASPDAVRFNNLEGRVLSVSPDTHKAPDGNPFYKVRIETNVGYFQSGANRYNLFPGMQVTASILTGERTVFQYLTDPLRNTSDQAFRER